MHPMARLDGIAAPYLDDQRLHEGGSLWVTRMVGKSRMVGSVDVAVLDAVGDELRLEILRLVGERPASTAQLARTLDRPKGTVGYHVKVLERAGLVRVVRTRRVRAVTEKLYGRTETDLSTFGVVQARMLEADAEHFVRRLQELAEEFAAAGSRAGTNFVLVAAVYADRRGDS